MFPVPPRSGAVDGQLMLSVQLRGCFRLALVACRELLT
jgi:hypothetical protein